MDLSCLINYNLLSFEKVDSTNEEAKRIAKCGAKGNFLIVAEEQISGKGQKGRSWKSPIGNLYMTIMLETNFTLKDLIQIPFLTANALVDTISSMVELGMLRINPNQISLKWPNDLLIDGKKLAGILIETLQVDGSNFIFIGIGVNIFDAPQVENVKTASLKNDCDYLGDVEQFMVELVKNFDLLYFNWSHARNFVEIRKKWLAKAHNLHKVITIDNGHRRISGIFREIDEEGAIVVEVASGDRCKLTFGEIIYNG